MLTLYNSLSTLSNLQYLPKKKEENKLKINQYNQHTFQIH